LIKAKALGIEKVTQRIEKEIEKLSKAKVNIDDVLEEGNKVATAKFAESQFNGIKVTKENSGETMGKLIASGKEVIFAEFGTGVTHTRGRENPMAVEFGFVPGSYGKGKGSNPYWGFYTDGEANAASFAGQDILSIKKLKNGNALVMTAGNKPAKAMYLATEAMKNKIKRGFFKK